MKNLHHDPEKNSTFRRMIETRQSLAPPEANRLRKNLCQDLSSRC